MHIFVHLSTFQMGSLGEGLIAAGLILRGYQDEPPGSRFRPGGGTEGLQNANDGSVGGQDPESNGCENCEEDCEGHEERDHDREILFY